MTKPTHGGSRPGSGRPPSGRTSITLRLLDTSIEKLLELAPTRLEQAGLIDELVKNHAGKKIRKTS